MRSKLIAQTTDNSADLKPSTAISALSRVARGRLCSLNAPRWRGPTSSFVTPSNRWRASGSTSAEVTRRGVVGDRVWAVRDEADRDHHRGQALAGTDDVQRAFPRISSRRVASRASARVQIELPDETEVTSDDPKTSTGGSPTSSGGRSRLCPLHAASDRRHYRAPKLRLAEMRRMFGVGAGDPLPDFSMFPLSKLGELTLFATPPGTYYDAYPLHLLTTASLEAMKRMAPQADFDVRRFRPNVLIETDQSAAEADAGAPDLREFGWCNATLSTGETRDGRQDPDRALLDAEPSTARAWRRHRGGQSPGRARQPLHWRIRGDHARRHDRHRRLGTSHAAAFVRAGSLRAGTAHRAQAAASESRLPPSCPKADATAWRAERSAIRVSICRCRDARVQ